MAFLSQALLLLLLSVSILGAGDLEANEYGDIDETPMGTEPALPEEVAGLAAGSEEIGADEAATEINSSETTETVDSTDAEEIVEDLEEAKPTMAEAVVYVFNNDDDTLSVSLFIDSELKETEDVSKDKEKKFGNYQLEAGSHRFKISWWDDDTKKTHQEELTATVEEETAITLYATQNKEPEEFEVNVMMRNENQEDLEAYLYIDGKYEKQKTAKKDSTTDFGKFDLEEGTHELAVRWQDPETNIEYEKRKTVRVDGKDVVTFYAPKGMTFESEEEKVASKTASSKTITNSKTISTSTKDDDEKEDISSQNGVSDSKQASSNSGEIDAPADKAKTSQEEETPSGDERKPKSDEKDENDSPDAGSATLYISTIGAILAIYIIFFRR